MYIRFVLLYLDYDEAMKVYEDEKNKFEYAGTDYGMDLYDRANIDQVRYKDGTVLTLDLTMGCLLYTSKE